MYIFVVVALLSSIKETNCLLEYLCYLKQMLRKENGSETFPAFLGNYDRQTYQKTD